MTNKKMNINKEAALKLWNSQFGNTEKAIDFAGRVIAKAAYNDRNSKYCWNVDHIYPQSLGGKTTPSNLICCHMLTNDEKADNYPAFTANGKNFVIKKVQNHYEIVELPSNNGNEADNDDEAGVNFFDAAAGLEFFEACKEKRWAGFVKIAISGIFDKGVVGQLYAFMRELFGCPIVTDSVLSYEGYYCGSEIFTLFDYNVERPEFVQIMLDNCVLLNTYLLHFKRIHKIENSKIFCGLKEYESILEAKKASESDFSPRFLNNSITINELVKINTDAKNKQLAGDYNGNYHYDFIYTNLNDDLKKQ